MNKNKILRLEMIIGALFLVFAVLIIFGERINKPKTIPEEVITEETEPEIDYTKIESVSGKYTYDDEYFHGSFGIDVSEFQDDIDWEKVKNDGVEFVFIRIGRRGATSGMLYDDPKFEANYSGARQYGIPVGVYFFSQAVSEAEALEEAKWVLEKLKGKQLDLPVVYDCEEVFFEDEKSRLEDVDRKQLTDNALAFLNEISQNGYDTMIYIYQYWADERVEMDRLTDYPIWYAQYDVKQPLSDHPFVIWQYSNKGTVNGIREPVDMNIMFTQKSDQPE